MRMLSASDLHSGMIVGVDIKNNGFTILPKGAILTEQTINQLSSYISPSYKIWVFDLMEIKPLLYKNSQYTRIYIDFLIKTFQQILTIDLSNEQALNTIVTILEQYLYVNRQFLYEILVLRDSHCYTYEHSLNVALYALIIGLNEELSNRELKTLIIGCLLHDLGKRNISINILNKPDRLSDKEFKAIRQHPLYGLEFANTIECIDERAKHIIVQHHEKLDGTGYPYGLKEDEIDHLAKIAAVADIFDAVTSNRAYHKKRSSLEGLQIVSKDAQSGKISKDEVANLILNFTYYPINTLVLLNNNVTGYVVNKGVNQNPVILGVDNKIYDLSARKGYKIAAVL